MSDTWYKRDPQKFLGGVQGMGPELIGAYSVIIEIIYARHGEMPRDDRHLAGVLGCSIRKARALTEQLIELKKIRIEGGNVVNSKAAETIEERRKQRETSVKPTRSGDENATTSNKNNGLVLQIREEKNNPLTPKGGFRRNIGVSDNVRKLVGEYK